MLHGQSGIPSLGTGHEGAVKRELNYKFYNSLLTSPSFIARRVQRVERWRDGEGYARNLILFLTLA